MDQLIAIGRIGNLAESPVNGAMAGPAPIRHGPSKTTDRAAPPLSVCAAIEGYFMVNLRMIAAAGGSIERSALAPERHSRRGMKSQILSEDSEFVAFKKGFGERGNPVDLSYLRHATVRGFFDSQGEMIAGYALNQQRPLRYEAWVPEEQRFKVPVLMSEPRLCELTCMWISDKPGRLTSERIYLQAILDSLATRAPFVVAGTLVPKIFGIQIQILSQVLYIGETTVFGRSQPCWIYGASRSALAKSLMTVVPIDFARKLLGRPSYLARAKVLAEVAEMEARRAGGDRPADSGTS